MSNISFGKILSDFRNEAGLKQKDLATALKVTASYIGLLETNVRGKEHPLTRDQAWTIIKALKLFPPKSDVLLEAAKLSPFRSEKEELEIQQTYPDLTELWIFARVIRDIDKEWFKVVKNNIYDVNNPARQVIYRYFTSDDDTCRNLVSKLLENGISKDKIEKAVECYLLPEELFLNNFAIYNPGAPNMYCCGGISEFGKGFKFYTYTESETARLYELLKKWRNRINGNQPIRLQDAVCVKLLNDGRNENHPFQGRSAFTSEIR